MKILIVGAQPFNENNQYRSLKSYFDSFSPNELVQIFSDSRIPCKGLCSKLYQITDKTLILKRFKKIDDRIYKYEELAEKPNSQELNKKRFRPKKKTGFYRFLRKRVWNKKYWLTPRLETFIDDFRPNAVFLSWGEDFFLVDVAEFFAKKYDIPIFVSITDDCYFFDGVRSDGFDLFRKLYLKKYRQRVDAFLKGDVYGFFVSDKIKRKYQDYFHIPGVVIPIGSSIEPIWKEPDIDLRNGIYYFGNLEYGRLKAIEIFARGLKKYLPSVKIHVFSKDISLEKNEENLILHPAIPYEKVTNMIRGIPSALLIAESFDEADVARVRYSLSTKVGDCFCAMKPIICIGGRGAGAVDFMKEQECSFVCNDVENMDSFCEGLLASFQKNASDFLRKQYEIARKTFDESASALKWRKSAEDFLAVSKTKKEYALKTKVAEMNEEGV
mgnify:CR=1 FL=1